jgi:putative phage-type endonuclease
MSWHGIPIPYTDRDDWLEKRRAGIGASDVAAILGLSPYRSSFEVWAEKMHGSERPATDAMEWGLRLEDVILEAFGDRRGLYTGARELLVRHPETEWAMATIDALAFESPRDPVFTDAIANIQVKTSNDWQRWEEIPDHYQLQCTWEMGVTGLDVTFLPVLHSGRRLEVYELEADAGLFDVLVEQVDAFRTAHLIDPESPPPEPAGTEPTRVLTQLWPGSDEDDAIELSEATRADLAALRGLRLQIAPLQEAAKKLEARIKVSLQDATIGLVDGAVAVTYKPSKGGWVERFYREPSRRLLVKDSKEE